MAKYRYDEIQTLPDVMGSAPYSRLSRLVEEIRPGKLTRDAFRNAAKAANSFSEFLTGLVGFAGPKNINLVLPKSLEGVNTTFFHSFFARPADQAGPKEEQRWLNLYSSRFAFTQRTASVYLRRYPVDLEFKHVGRRLWEISGDVLDLHSNPVAVAVLTATMMSFVFQKTAGVVKSDDGTIPFVLPMPKGMLFGYATPSTAADFNYTDAKRLGWARQTLPAAASTQTVLPGLPGHKPTPKAPPLPILQQPKIPRTGPLPTLPNVGQPQTATATTETFVDAKIAPPLAPPFKLSIHTHVDFRRLQGRQKSLFHHKLYPLLNDKKFIDGLVLFAEEYILGSAPRQPNQQNAALIEYSENRLKEIILSPQWRDQAHRSLESLKRKMAAQATRT